jgi:hypothetical protein
MQLLFSLCAAAIFWAQESLQKPSASSNQDREDVVQALAKAGIDMTELPQLHNVQATEPSVARCPLAVRLKRKSEHVAFRAVPLTFCN